jgi:hypothetical protein
MLTAVIDLSPLVLYLVSLTIGIQVFIQLQKNRTHILLPIRDSMQLLIIFSMTLSVLFCILQVFWTLNGHWSEMSAIENIGWFFYDWLNAAVHLAFCLLIRGILHWSNRIQALTPVELARYIQSVETANPLEQGESHARR